MKLTFSNKTIAFEKFSIIENFYVTLFFYLSLQPIKNVADVGQIFYLIKFEGYPNFENSWEPAHNLVGQKGVFNFFATSKF